jgi:DNA-binding transcriptional LysR family regulator
LTLTTAAQGHGVAIGDPRMAMERLQTGALVAPFSQVVENGLRYFLVYPPQRAEQSKIRALAEVLVKMAKAEEKQSNVS